MEAYVGGLKLKVGNLMGSKKCIKELGMLGVFWEQKIRLKFGNFLNFEREENTNQYSNTEKCKFKCFSSQK